MSLLSFMDGIQYGYVDHKGRVRLNMDDKFYTDYRLQSPAEVVVSGHGVCWDQVELERAYLARLGFLTQTYYVIVQGGNSHTFLTFYGPDGLYWLEHSWGRLRGLYGPFLGLVGVLDVVVPELLSEKDDADPTIGGVFRYVRPKSGITCQEFMDFCSQGTRIDYENVER